MLSFRRIGVLSLLVMLCAAVFISYSWNSRIQKTLGYSLPEPARQQWLPAVNADEQQRMQMVFALPKEDSAEKNAVMNSLTDYLSATRQSWMFQQGKVDFSALNQKRDILIFPSETISDVCDLRKLTEWIDQGGKAILAGGLSDGNADVYLHPMLGIREHGTREQCSKFAMVTQMLPIDCASLRFDEFNASLHILTSDDVQVYLNEEDKDTPIVYSRKYGKGQIGVFNTNFLEYKENAGWFAAMVNQLAEVNVYPVLGKGTLIFDNFPFSMVISDEVSMNLYGKNFEAFILDNFFPALQRLSLQHGVVINAAMPIAAGPTGGFNEVNRNLLFSLADNLLRYRSEILFSSWMDQAESKVKYNTDLLELVGAILPEYQISAMEFTGKGYPEALSVPGYPVAAICTGPQNEYAEKQDGTIPVLSSGIQIENAQGFMLLGQLAGYGGYVHSLDCIPMISDGTGLAWNQAVEDLRYLENEIIDRTDWLESSSVSDLAGTFDSLEKLSYQWQMQDHELILTVSEAAKGQPFMIYSQKPFGEIQGGTMKELKNGYWMINAQANEIHISVDD